MPKVFSDEQENKIKTFINLALDFNKTHNIFSRESYDDVYENDILDCKPLINHIKKNESVLDLGSGGGFPGILLSIIKPENKINLLESNNKKCYFLKKVFKPKKKDTDLYKRAAIESKYMGYLEKQKREIKKTQKQNNKKIPQDLKYNNIRGLSNEVKEKLIKHKPETIGHASKIEGVTPAAVNLILIQIKTKEILKQHA